MKRLVWISVIANVFFLDIFSKLLVKRYVPFYGEKEIIPNFFSITNIVNRGTVFGFFSTHERGFLYFIFLALSIFAFILILYVFFKTSPNEIIANLSFSFIIGGALGNIFDRIVNGGVTDFIDIYYGSFRWPTFNLADFFITIGAILIIGEMILHRKRRVCSLSS
jgi:signal peptidase II